MTDFIIGLALSFFISYAAYKKESLSISGIILATVYGAGLYLFGGLYFFLAMISFFISSSLLSHFKKTKKSKYEDGNGKSGKRDYTQVIANGFPSFLFGLLYYLMGNHLYILGFSTALAAANADTWASEIGLLSKKNPISIITWKPIEKGLSGGISLLGTLASLAGSAFISFISLVGYIIRFGFKDYLLVYFFLSILGGFLGSIIDSILGATVQAKYKRTDSRDITEKRYTKGIKNVIYSGISFVDNNFVNLSSGLLSSVIITWFYYLIA